MATNSIFQFIGYKVLKSQIEIEETEDVELNVDIDLKGLINKEKSSYDLTLFLKINNISESVKISTTTVGNFSFPKDHNLEELSTYFYMNAPALLFPYVRAYIATLTNLSGIDPINLHTLNLTQYREKLKNQTETI